MKQKIFEFIKNLISKKEILPQIKENIEAEEEFFDKNSTFEYFEPFGAPTEDEIKKLEHRVRYEKPFSVGYICLNPSPSVVYDTKNRNKTGILYPYDKYDIETERLQGYRIKNFFICRSKNLFNELEHELQNNPNCSYITHANEAIKNGDHLNSYSVLFFACTTNNSMDELSSKLLNYYEIPTIYNKTISIFDGAKEEEIKGILSVDFIKEGYIFTSLKDHNSISFIDIESQINCLKHQVDLFYENIENKTPDYIIEKKKEKICKDYAKSYICRNLMLSSTDFDFKNVGLVMNNVTGDIQLAPNFDLESTLGTELCSTSLVFSTITYFKENYPEILKDLIHKTDYLLEKNKDGISPFDTLLNENNHLFLENSYPNKQEISERIRSSLDIIKSNLSPSFYKEQNKTEKEI